MKVLHLISGGETGGSKNHLISLLEKCKNEEIYLGVFQEGILAEEARQQGITVIVFGQSSRYDLSILSKLKALILEKGIQIVHTHGPRANLYTFILRKQTSFKWITTIHSDPEKDFIKGGIKGRLFTGLNMLVIKRIDHFFAVSERFKQMLVGFGIKGSKITTIYNGIDFHLDLKINIRREEIGLSDDDFVIIMAARLHPIKGHVVAFQALNSLVQKGKRVKLLLVGNGPIEKELKEEVNKLDLNRQVQFLGFQSDVHSYLSIADVKLLASYSESFPLVILESARAHTPVISTDVGGVKDMISDKTLGWIVPIKDAGSIEEAILDAIQMKDSGKLVFIGEHLYKKASSTYSVDQLANKTLDTYRSL